MSAVHRSAVRTSRGGAVLLTVLWTALAAGMFLYCAGESLPLLLRSVPQTGKQAASVPAAAPESVRPQTAAASAAAPVCSVPAGHIGGFTLSGDPDFRLELPVGGSVQVQGPVFVRRPLCWSFVIPGKWHLDAAAQTQLDHPLVQGISLAQRPDGVRVRILLKKWPPRGAKAPKVTAAEGMLVLEMAADGGRPRP